MCNILTYNIQVGHVYYIPILLIKFTCIAPKIVYPPLSVWSKTFVYDMTCYSNNSFVKTGEKFTL